MSHPEERNEAQYLYEAQQILGKAETGPKHYENELRVIAEALAKRDLLLAKERAERHTPECKKCNTTWTMCQCELKSELGKEKERTAEAEQFFEKYRNHQSQHPDDERAWIPLLLDAEKQLAVLLKENTELKSGCCNCEYHLTKKSNEKIEALDAQAEALEEALESAIPHIQFLIARNPQHEEPHKTMRLIEDALTAYRSRGGT